MSAASVPQNAESNFKDWLKQQVRTFGAEMTAVFREGREDTWNAIVPAFPDSMQSARETGAPGTPTPQLVTEALKGRDVDNATDLLAASNEQTPQQDMGMDRTRDGRSM